MISLCIARTILFISKTSYRREGKGKTEQKKIEEQSYNLYSLLFHNRGNNKAKNKINLLEKKNNNKKLEKKVKRLIDYLKIGCNFTALTEHIIHCFFFQVN